MKESTPMTTHCENKCNQSTHMMRHERIHIGDNPGHDERPFSCSHCDKKFKNTNLFSKANFGSQMKFGYKMKFGHKMNFGFKTPINTDDEA